MAEEVMRAKIIIDVKDAISSYTELRQRHVSMVTALNTGAGALATTGAAFAGAGALIAGGFITATLAAGEFERKLDFFGAVSNASVRDMEKIRAKALELGADTMYSADQVADSFTTLAKAGVGAQEILAGIGEAVTNLGAATDMPLTEAASSLTTILNTFNIAAEDSVAVVDKLAGAANSSNIDVQDLILTMTYAGSSAALLGVSFEDVNTAIAVLGEAGIKGSKAGTGLRQMFDKLAAPTKAGSEALRELGIVTDEAGNRLLTAEGKMRPLPEVLDTINDALDAQGLNAAEKIDVLGKIFPITSLPTILNLLQGGSEAMAQLNEEINKASAADIASDRLNNLSGDIEILRGNLDTLIISIGSTQQSLARGLVQAISSVVDWLNSLNPELLGMLVLFGQIVAVVLIVIGVFGLMAGAVLQIIALGIRIADSWYLITGILTKVAGLFSRIFAVALGPIGTIILVIGALAAAFIYFFTQTEAGQKTWATIVKTFQDAFTTLGPSFAALGAAFGQLGGTLIPLLTEIGTILLGGLVTGLTALAPAMVVFAEAVAGTLVVALQIVVPLLTGLVELLTGPLGGVLLGIAAAIGVVVAAIKIWVAVQWLINAALTANPIGVIIMAIAALVAAIIWVATQTTFFQDVWTAVSGFLIATWTNISNFFIAVWTNISNFFMTVWNAIVAFLTPIIMYISEVIRVAVETWQNIFLVLSAVLWVIFTAIGVIFTTVWNAIVAFITPIVQFISDVITNAVNGVKAVWTAVWGAISSFFTDIWNRIISFLVPIVMRVKSAIEGPVRQVQGTWNSIWSAISSFFSGIWNGIVSAVTGAVGQVISVVSSIYGKVMSVLSGAASWLVSVGKNIIQGLINGITSMIGNVMKAVGNVVNGAINWAKGILGVQSPSTVFRDIGMNTILGMIVGVKATQPALERTMNIVGDSIEGFYDQVYAAREMDVMLNLQSQMGVDAYSATQANQLALLNEKLQEIAEKDTVNIEKIENNYPEPEPASDSLPNNIRKATAMVG